MFNQEALRSIIETGAIPYKQNAISYIFRCPRCLKKDKLYIRKRDGRMVCWVCKETDNFQGRPEWALKELYEFTLAELRKQLYGDYVSSEQTSELVLEFNDIWDENEEEVFAASIVPTALCWPPDFLQLGDKHFSDGLSYLLKRGISEQLIKEYDIRYHPSERRVIFPVKIDGNLIGWQGRYIDSTTKFNEETSEIYEIPKILTSLSLRNQGGRYLMFQDRLKNSGHCVLTEGPVSSLHCDQLGGNVASMGKAVTGWQIETILQSGVEKIYLGLDPDAADETSRLVDQYSHYDVETYLLLPPVGKEDLGECTSEEVLEQFKRAPRLQRGTLFFSLGNQFIF